MGLQYLRNVRVEVAGGLTVNYDGEQNGGQGFRIRFDVRLGNTSTPNVAEILITNLKDSTTQPAFHAGKEVTLSVGYDQGIQTIFKGQVKQARNMREDWTDKILNLLCTDSARARNYAVVNKALQSGHTHMDRAQLAIDALKQLGVSQGYIDTDALTKTKFPRGFVAHGNAKDLLRAISLATKTTWSIQQGKVQILGNDKPLPGGAIKLNAQTGLIGLPEQTINGIEGRCLLNGQIVPGSLIQIDQRSIQKGAFDPSYLGDVKNLNLSPIATDGIYKVWVVGHNGDTRGNEFFTSFIAIKNGQDISIPLASQGYGDGVQSGPRGISTAQ